MAQTKKYAGLLDLDQAPEIYETPDLTDDTSTNQTATIRSTSPSPSDEDNFYDADAGLDRQHLDREEARRRFERSAVDARDVNFSDSLASNRRSYSITNRRRRIRGNGVEELGDLSDSEDETLARKLARLRREAEEIKLELEKRKEKPASVDENEDEGDMADGVVKLSELLDDMNKTARSAIGTRTTTEGPLARRPAPPMVRPSSSDQANAGPQLAASSSTTSAIATFSDRLSVLESALGLASTPWTTESTSILPTLNSLSTQINALSTSLVSRTPTNLSSSETKATTSSQAQSTLPHLDALASSLSNLAAESEKLTAARKRALDSYHELVVARDRDPIKHFNIPPHPDAQREITKHVVEESSAKIAALYATLPTIQNLQPLLPVVLERLRSLQGLHAGAATAKEDLDEVERRQAEIGKEIERWKTGLENVEKRMKEWEKVMGENREVLREMVGGVEERMGRLEAR